MKEFIIEQWEKNINKNYYNTIYIDIPFCEQYCKYCIYSQHNEATFEKIEKYLISLSNEMNYFSRVFKNKKISAFHIGGGSPSILTVRQIKFLKSLLTDSYNIDKNGTRSIELNPFDLTKEKIYTLFNDTLFNRVSIGIQSFNEEVLKKENRLYTSPKTLKDQINYIKEINPNININVDLIIGLNDESKESILQSFDILDKLNINKITMFENSSKERSEETTIFSKNIISDINSKYNRYYNTTNIDLKGYNKDIRLISFFYNKEREVEYDYIYGEIYANFNLLAFGPRSKSFIANDMLEYSRDEELNFNNSKYSYYYNNNSTILNNISITNQLFQKKNGKFRF